MSDTPRTDEFCQAQYAESCAAAATGYAPVYGQDKSPEESYGDAIDFARTIERELAETTAEMLRIHNEKVDHFEARIAAERENATLTAEVERKQAALVELIACKDLMGIIETLEGQTSPWTEGQNMQYVEAKKHYERRKPLAWTAARRAVLPVGGEG